MTHVMYVENMYEKLLTILEVTHFSTSQSLGSRYKKKEMITEFVVNVAVNIAYLCLQFH